MAGMVARRGNDPNLPPEIRRVQQTFKGVWIAAIVSWFGLRMTGAFDTMPAWGRWAVLIGLGVGISLISSMVQSRVRDRLRQQGGVPLNQPYGQTSTQPYGQPYAQPSGQVSQPYGAAPSGAPMPGSWPTDGSFPSASTSYPSSVDAQAYQPERSHEQVHSGTANGLDFPVEHVSVRPDGAISVFGVVNLGEARVGEQVRVLRPGQGEQVATLSAIVVGGQWVASAGLDQAVELVLTGVPVGMVEPGDRVVN